MKRILIAGAFALPTAAPAFTCDLPPAAMPPPRLGRVCAGTGFSWTGFYIGANAGYAFGQSSWNSPIGTTGNFDVSGPMAGVTLGGNYQIGQFVVGAETDIDWQNVRGSQVGGNCNLGPGAPASWPASNWSARPGPRRLRHGPCAALRNRRRRLRQHQGFARRFPVGQQHGIGLDRGRRRRIAMTDNWTAKVEYLFADFQHASCGAANCLAVPPPASASTRASCRSASTTNSATDGSAAAAAPSRPGMGQAKGLEITARRIPPRCSLLHYPDACGTSVLPKPNPSLASKCAV